MDGETTTAVPELLAILADDRQEPGMRIQAAETLGRMGAEAKAAVPALIAVFADEGQDLEVRLSAAKALGNLANQTVRVAALGLRPLIEALADERDRIRVSATQILASIGPHARAAIPALIQAFEDPDPSVRQNACTAIDSAAIHQGITMRLTRQLHLPASRSKKKVAIVPKAFYP